MKVPKSQAPSLILHVAALKNVAGGGLPASLAALHEALPADTELAILLPTESSAFAWVDALRERGIATYFASSTFEVVRTVVRLRPAIVHTHFVRWQLPATIGARLAHARIFWHLHSGVRASVSRFVTLKYKLAKKVIERFVCVSPDIAAYLQKHGIPASQITEIANGIDLEKFHIPSERERTEARAALKLDDRARAIMFFGRDAHIKGADRLAQSLDVLRQSTGHLYDVLCVASSQESIALLSKVAHVHDLGVVPDIRSVVWAADVLALPSRVEALPFAVLEARATGLPVVATDLAGMKQLAGDPGTTCLPFEARGFAASLTEAMEHGRVALLQNVAERISLQRWTEHVAALYNFSHIPEKRVHHVLHIVHHLGTYGGERFVRSLALAQRRTIDEVTIVTFADSHVEVPGVRVITVPRYPTLTFLPRLVGAIRALNPDIVHTHLAHAKFWGRTAAVLATNAPLIHTEHGNDFNVSLFRRFATRLLHKKTIAITAFSSSHADRISTFEKVPRGKMHVIPNGIELSTSHRDAASCHSSNIRVECGIDSDAVVLLGLARLDAIKAHDLAIEALAILPKDMNAHLLITGTGPLEPELRALSQRCGVEGRVHFLGYRTDRDALLASADVFINTSLSEAMPLALIEGMCAGLPIACAPWPGASEILHEAIAAISADRSPQAFATAVGMVSNPEARRAAKELAASFRIRFDITTIAGEYGTLYTRVQH